MNNLQLTALVFFTLGLFVGACFLLSSIAIGAYRDVCRVISNIRQGEDNHF